MIRIGMCLIGMVLCFSVSAQNLIVGTPPFSPPFVMADDASHHFSGFDVAIIMTVCQRISATCVLKPIPEFEATIDALENGEIDLMIGDITITPEREQEFLFSLPYLASYAQFISLASSPVNSLANLHGKTVGCERATLFPSLTNNILAGNVSIKTYVEIPAMLTALGNNEIDALVTDEQTADYWYANNLDTYKLIGKAIPLGLGYGIAATKGKDALIASINKALLAMESDGTYLKIYNTYFSAK